MIDYIKCIVDCNHKAIGEKIVASTYLKDINDISSENTIFYHTGKNFKGKYDSQIKIRTYGNKENNKVEISGNFNKFIQGHNIFGTKNISKLIKLTTDILIESDIGLAPNSYQLDCMKFGLVKLTRVDINRNFHLPCKNDVDNWIKAARDNMTMSHYGSVEPYNSTLYFGKNSHTKEIKFYGKGEEVLCNRSLPVALQTPEMIDYINRMLRFEIKLKAKYLIDNNLSYAESWDTDLPDFILDEHLNRVNLSANMRLSNQKLSGLKNCYIATYYKWLKGNNLKDIMNPNTYYRHRRELLKYNIDIATSYYESKPSGINLADVLSNNVIDTPNWAYNQNLVIE